MNTPSYLRIFCSLALILLSQAGRAEMPDLQPIDFQMPTTISGPPGMQVALTYVITNRGDMPALNYWEDRIYLSAKPQFDSSAVLAYTRNHYSRLDELCAEASEVTFSLLATNAGVYYLLVDVDAVGAVAEYDDSNNQISRSFTFTPAYPNLGIAKFEVPARITGSAPPDITYSITLTNTGTASVVGSWVNKLYWSIDAVLDSTDVLLDNPSQWDSIPPSGMLVGEHEITVSALKTNGSGWIIVKVDSSEEIPDSDRGNNTAAAPFTFELVPLDLRPINFRLTNSILITGPNPYAEARWELTNSGPGSLGFLMLGYEMYFSTNASMAAAVELSDSTVWGPLAPGEGKEIRTGLNLPVTESGRYYLSVVVDPDNHVAETNEINNRLVISLDVEIQQPDVAILPGLTQTNFTGAQNPHMELVFSTTNSGPFNIHDCYTGVFFSKDAVLDSSDRLLAVSYESLASQGYMTQTNQLRLPVTESGRYYLIEKADPHGFLAESNEANNLQVVTVDVTILRPDLEPVGLQVPGVYSGPDVANLSISYTITNRAPALAMDRLEWYDTIYLSTNGLLDAKSFVLSNGPRSAPLNGFSALSVTNSVIMPAGVNGDARVFVRVNAVESVLELSTNNNVISAPLQIAITQPDLIPVAVSVPVVVNGGPFPNVDILWGITNAGPGAALGSMYRQIYFSTNATLEPEWDLYVASQWDDIALSSGSSQRYEESISVRLTNSVSGYLLFVSDAFDRISEINEANNIVAVPISFAITWPDLVALPIIFPDQLTTSPEPRALVAWGISNAGPGRVDATWPPIVSTLHLSRNDRYDDWDSQLVSRNFDSVLPAGGVAWFTNEVQLYITNSGSWHLAACVDTDNSFLEVSTLNNTFSVPFSITINYPDVVAGPAKVPANLIYTPNSQISVTLAATNFGLGTMRSSGWNHTLWISSKPVIDDAAIHLRFVGIDKQLGTGEGYAEQVSVALPITNSGTYYLISEAGRLLPWDSSLANNVAVQILNVQVTPADLQPVSLQVSVPPTELPNPIVRFVAGVTNHGPGAAHADGARRDSLVLSRDAKLDSSDKLLTSHRMAEQQPAQTMLLFTNEVTLPITESGTYYLFWVVDDWQSVPEANESNNAFMKALNITVTPPDLAPVQFSIPHQISGPPYPWVTVVHAVTNYGPGQTLGLPSSTLCVPVGSEIRVVASPTGEPLQPGGVYWRTNYLRLPFAESGTYEVVLEVNPYQTLFESSYTNNAVTNRVVFTAVLPNLSPVRLVAPAVWTIPEDQNLTVSYAITNSGPGIAVPNNGWEEALFLSSDTKLSPDDLSCFWAARTAPLAPYSSSWSSADVSFSGVTPGSYYLLLVINKDKYFVESSTEDNMLAVPITIRDRKPDLVPQQLIAPAIITNPVGYVTFAWHVMNQGLGGVRRDANWNDIVSLCPTPEFDYSLYATPWGEATGPLPMAAGYWVTNTIWFTAAEDTDGYFVLRTGDGLGLGEVATENNSLAVPVKVRLNKPDLAIIDVETPASVTAAPGAPVEVRWGITNAGTGATRPDTLVRAEVRYSNGACPVVEHPGLPPGGSAHFTNIFYLPSGITTNLQLVFVADPYEEQIEVTRTNNLVTRSIPVDLHNPDLEVSILSYPTNLSFTPYQPVQFVCAVTNIGSGTARLSRYHSLTLRKSAGESVIPLYTDNEPSSLPPGEVLWLTNTFRIPPDAPVGLVLGELKINPIREYPEANWENNDVELQIELELGNLPDLAASLAILETNASNVAEPFVRVRWALTNLGPGDFYFKDGFPISFMLTRDSSYVQFMDIATPTFIPAGGNVIGTNDFLINVIGKGLYNLVMGGPSSYEFTTTNNGAAVAFLMDNEPDLAISTLIAPTSVTGTPNQHVTVITEVKNEGTGRARAGWHLAVTLNSPYSGYGACATVASIEGAQPMSPGESQWFTNVIWMPPLAAGTYRWWAQVFPQDYYTYANTNWPNDTRGLSVQLSLSRPSQLRALSLTADAQATSTNPVAQLRWSVINDGDGPTAYDWVDSVYYSLDSQVSFDDTLVASRTNLAGLTSGATYSWQASANLPADARSGAFLLLFADSGVALWDDAWADNYLPTVLQVAPLKPGPTWMSEPRFVNGRFQATLHGAAGQSVVLQVSTNLIDWESLRALTFQTEELDIEDTNSGESAPRFYRLIPLSELD